MIIMYIIMLRNNGIKRIPNIVSNTILFFTKKLPWYNHDKYMKNNMKKRNEENYVFAQSLIEKGHVCVCYRESYPVQINETQIRKIQLLSK